MLQQVIDLNRLQDFATAYALGTSLLVVVKTMLASKGLITEAACRRLRRHLVVRTGMRQQALFPAVSFPTLIRAYKLRRGGVDSHEMSPYSAWVVMAICTAINLKSYNTAVIFVLVAEVGLKARVSARLVPHL